MEKTDLKTQLAEVAERIRTMREITGLSEGEMAKCTGVPLEEYQQCEAGEKDFSFTFIYKCAQRFGIDPTDLIKGVSLVQLHRQPQGRRPAHHPAAGL